MLFEFLILRFNFLLTKLTTMKKCPITGLQKFDVGTESYRIEFNDEKRFIRHGLRFDNLLNDEFFIKNKHLIAGAIFNKQLADEHEDDIYWFTLVLDDYKEKISKLSYPKTPKDKLDNLFKTLCEMQDFDGEKVAADNLIDKPDFFYKHYFRSEAECFYYLKNLDFQGLINLGYNEDIDFVIEFNVTFEGLNYFINLKEQGNLSNKCFVAMSFDTSMSETREAIRTAVLQNNYDPIIIDEELIDSSQTINDAIIVALKSCCFCIADFSQQKDGVYFESGFAAGLGRPVIYTCQKEWFDKSHFDTNHFPHIIYTTNDDLIDQLDKKIKAWI